MHIAYCYYRAGQFKVIEDWGLTDSPTTLSMCSQVLLLGYLSIATVVPTRN